MKKWKISLFSPIKGSIIFGILGILMLGSCSDDNKIETLNTFRTNEIQLSIPDAKLVQVRSVASEKECMINSLQVLIYNDTYTSAPIYYQEGKSGQLSFLFGNGTASPTITLKDYIPQNGDRVYVLCNMTDRNSISDKGDYLLNETTSEEQLKNYSSQGLIKGRAINPNVWLDRMERDGYFKCMFVNSLFCENYCKCEFGAIVS